MLYETQRLIARRYQASDAQALYQMLSDAETVFYEPYDTLDESECRMEAENRAKDASFLAICLRETGELIGTVYLGAQECGNFELGYVFARAYWGRGLAGEAARGALAYAFNVLGARRVIAFAARQNARSWRLLERIGMRREGLMLQNVFFKRDAQGEPILLDSYAYALLASEASAGQ